MWYSSLVFHSLTVAECVCCSKDWDQYTKCSSSHCHQLLLSCTECQAEGKTACCIQCADNAESGSNKEECQCTRRRTRDKHDANSDAS